MDNWTTLQPHPIADIFPMMDDASFNALRSDIALNGLREAIWLHPDGRILDGRNRHRACVALRLKPTMKVYAGELTTEALVAFVISLNLQRRHLDSGQRAFVGLEIERVLAEAAKERQVAAGEQHGRGMDSLVKDLTKLSDRNDSKAAAQAAAVVGTNRQYMADAKKIRQEAPDLEEKVVKGEMSMPKAKQEMKQRKRAAEKEARASTIRVEDLSEEESVPPAAGPASWTDKTIGDVTIWRADSRNLTGETAIPPTVDLVITSPPYNVGIEYSEHFDKMKMEQYADLLHNVFLGCNKVMRHGARLAVVVPFGVGRNPWQPISLFVAQMIQKAGFILRGQIIWDKGTSGNRTSWGSFRSPSDPSLRDTSECILVAHKTQSGAQVPSNVLRKDDKGAHSPWLESSDYFMELAQDHWQVAPESAQRVKHPAPFPVELVKRLVHFYGWPGCTLLDPFGGSGTVGVVAAQLGCTAHVVDIDPAYCALAARRVDAAYAGRQMMEENNQ